MRTPLLIAVALLWVAQPAFGQPTEEVRKLLEKGNELLNALPAVPSDLQEEYFYTMEEKDQKVGWKQIRIDTVTKRGETYYRYRARYGIDSMSFGWAEGEMSVILDRKLTPLDVNNEMFFINPESGKREIVDRTRIKNNAFRRKVFDGRQTIKRKFDLEKTQVAMLVEPLIGRLKLEEGEKFAFLDYDIFQGQFRTLVCEVKGKEDGKQRIVLELKGLVDDPNNAKKIDVESPPVPINEDEETDGSRDGSTKKPEYFMLVDPGKSLYYLFDPVYKIETRISNADEVDVVKKDLEIKPEDIPTT